MAADSRSTHTDALATLGTIIGEGEKRDAIHLGVEPIIAAIDLWPGQHVRWASREQKAVVAAEVGDKRAIGIVDPFLTDGVEKGQRFWLIVYPRQITSLRHVWEHPSFPASKEIELQAAPAPVNGPTEEQLHQTKVLLGEPKAVAKEAIRRIADGLGVGFDELLERTRDYLMDGEYWSEGGRFEGAWIPDEFWQHYQILTDTAVPTNQQHSFFSCAC